MTILVIRIKYINNNNFVYFVIKNIVIFHKENNLAVVEDNTFQNKDNKVKYKT